jgi:hypothetical protein
VTNNPLAVCDFSTLDVEQDILHMAGSYGTAYGVSSSGELCTASHGRFWLDRLTNDGVRPADQRWGYVSNMMPDEAYLLRCFDSQQGRYGEALYAGHVACTVLNEEQLQLDHDVVHVPRRSVEVRLFVLHE